MAYKTRHRNKRSNYISSSWCRPAYNIGQFLYQYRSGLKWSEHEMAKYLEVPYGQYYRYEKGFFALRKEHIKKLSSRKDFPAHEFNKFWEADNFIVEGTNYSGMIMYGAFLLVLAVLSLQKYF